MLTYDKIVFELKVEFPKFKIVQKDKSWLMWFQYYAMLMFLWNKVYMTDFITVFGNTVYMPLSFIGTKDGADVLRHERVHMRDSRGWMKIPYCISYIMLPIGPSGRAYWEFRAYVETMQACYDRYGFIPDDFIDFITDIFTGPKYLFMFPFPKTIRKWLLEARTKIRSKPRV
jgi:hypothetical protein